MNQLLLNKSTLECNQLVKLFVLLPFVGSSQLCIATNRQPRVTECYKSWIVKGFRLLTFKQFKFCDWFLCILYYKGHIHLLTSLNHLNKMFMYNLNPCSHTNTCMRAYQSGSDTARALIRAAPFCFTLLENSSYANCCVHKIHVSWGPPIHPYQYGCMYMWPNMMQYILVHQPMQ